MNIFPVNANTAIKMNTVIRHKKPISLYERMSTKMVKCASSLSRNGFIGWEMYVPVKGLAKLFLFSTEEVTKGDIDWIAEHTAKTAQASLNSSGCSDSLSTLYEIRLPIYNIGAHVIGFGSSFEDKTTEVLEKLPLRFSAQFAELVNVFRNSGACFREVVGSADEEERQICKKEFMKSALISDTDPLEYIGKPVRAKFLLRLPSKASIRLKTVLKRRFRGLSLNISVL